MLVINYSNWHTMHSHLHIVWGETAFKNISCVQVFCLNVCQMSVYHTGAWCHEGQKRAPSPLGLELAEPPWGWLGAEPEFSGRTAIVVSLECFYCKWSRISMLIEKRIFQKTICNSIKEIYLLWIFSRETNFFRWDDMQYNFFYDFWKKTGQKWDFFCIFFAALIGKKYL